MMNTPLTFKATAASIAPLARSGRIGVWQLDLQTDTLLWDAATSRLYGEEPALAPVSRAFWQQHMHADDRDAVNAAMQAAIEGLKPLDIAYRICTRDGEHHHLRSIGRVVCDGRGVPRRLTGVSWVERPLPPDIDQHITPQTSGAH